MKIGDILAEELVVASLRGKTKTEVIEELASVIARQHPEIDRLRLIQALEDRERLNSTALGDGVAIPHGKLPDVAGTESELADLRAIFPGVEVVEVIRADRDCWQYVRELRARREQRKVIERQEAELQARIAAFMGNATSLISPHDDEVATWKPRATSRLDTKALRAAHPALADEFTDRGRTRTFLLK